MSLMHKRLTATRQGGTYDPTQIRFWVDGGMLGRRNPSTEGVFWSVYCLVPLHPDDGPGVGTVVVNRKKSRRHFTNNEAEWLALREALKYARKHCRKKSIHIHSDSRLVVHQFNKRWACNVPRLRVLAIQCWEIAADFKTCYVSWRPRREMVVRLGH